MSEHTKEPWIVMMSDNATPHIMTSLALGIDDPHHTICWMPAEITQNFNALANARRIVACVNACAGISTESLEKQPGATNKGIADYVKTFLENEALTNRIQSLEAALKKVKGLLEQSTKHALFNNIPAHSLSEAVFITEALACIDQALGVSHE